MSDSDATPAVSTKEQDARDYVREWRIWLGVAVIVAAVLGLLSWRAGHFVAAWPAIIVMGVWAAILLALPIFPAKDSS